MPRNGQGVLSKPANSTAQPNTTIESAMFNSVVDDLYQDGNAVRPTAAGGTGAATSVGAADNIMASGANIASAATTNLAAATGVSVTVTGTTTITSFGNAPTGAWRIVTFAGALTLTHNATNLILPGAANIVTAAGDVGMFISLGSARWRCVGYTKAAGIFSGTVTFPGNPVIQNASPLLRFSDTDAGTYDAQWILNSNNMYLQGSPNGSTYSTKIQFELDTNNVYFGSGSSVALVWNGTAVPLNVGGTGATNAANARTNLGLGGLATMDIGDLVYNGSSASNVNYPVGTVVAFGGGAIARNSAVTIRLNESNNVSFLSSGSGAVLAGTWRGHGQTSGGENLAQRTA